MIDLESEKVYSKKELMQKASFQAKVFQRKVHVARELGTMEEKYYQDQL